MMKFTQPLEFLWDEGNKDKNFIKHGVTNTECEEVFFDRHKRIYQDGIHSKQETRYILLGQTKRKRWLFIVFTWRGNAIRVISARDLNKREMHLYEKDS